MIDANDACGRWTAYLKGLHAGGNDAAAEARGMLGAALSVIGVLHGPRVAADMCDRLAQEFTDQTLREEAAS